MSLKRKSAYTSATQALNIIIGFIAQLVITPIILGGLGSNLFGVFTIVNKIQGYMALADLRPSAVLRYKLAILQNSTNMDQKKEYVGASILLSILSFPILVSIGWLISIYFNSIFKIDLIYYNEVSTAIILLSIIIGLKSFFGVPEAIIRGNNLEYRSYFVEPIRVLVYGVCVYYFLAINLGLIGIIWAIGIAVLIEYFLKQYLQIKYLKGYSPIRPSGTKLREFFGNSFWYMNASLFAQILNTFDLIFIGIYYNATTVTVYSLSKVMLFRVSESIITVISGITSSIGHLIGENRFLELIKIRETLFRINIIFSFFLASYFLFFTESFVTLWVGKEYYVGDVINLFFCISTIFVLMSMTEELFINSLHLYKQKALILFGSTMIGVTSAYMLNNYYGLISIIYGLLIAKSLQWMFYFSLLNRYVGIKFFSVLLKNKIAIIILISVYVIYIRFGGFEILSWPKFVMLSFLHSFFVLTIIFNVLLNTKERNKIINLVKSRMDSA